MKRGLLALFAASIVWGQVQLPPYTRHELANGTVVYLLPRTKVPMVSFRVLVRGGTESDPASQPGLSWIAGELLQRGTTSRTADQFSEQLESLGAMFRPEEDEQSSIVTAEFLKKDFDRGLELVADAVLHPSFPADEVRKELARAIDRTKAMKDRPEEAIWQYYRTFFFGPKSPYGRIPDEAGFDRIRREDIVAYHRRAFVGKNLIIIVAGDFDPAAAKARIESAFGSAPAGTPYSWAVDSAPPSAGGPRLLLVDKPGSTQTYFFIAQPGITRNTPDRVPILLANTLFGGRFTSMLNDELRVNTGLTYGASSDVQQSRLTGGLVINTFTKTESTAQAIDLALDVLKRLREKGITADQLASAKAYLKGMFPTQQLETNEQLANMLGELELFGLSRDEVDQFFARINAVTLDEINDVVRRRYRSDNLTLVLLGDASKIRSVAAKYAPRFVERAVQQPGW